MATASVARAGDDARLLCFEPGTTILLSEAYVHARELRAEVGGEPSWKAHVVLRVPGGREAVGLKFEQWNEARLELARSGVRLTSIEQADGPDRQDCIEAEIALDAHYMTTWHFYGPYFGPDSAEVTEVWRRSMRFLTITIQPGAWRYCIQGHADAGGHERNPMDLSRRRAMAVERELIRQGVPEGDIEVRPYGDTLPVRVPTEAPEPLNRRVFVDVREVCRFDR